METRGSRIEAAAGTRLPADQRRETILEAGAALFAERGFNGTTLDQVAAGAGVTKPILYRHFASKKDLYLALLRRHSEDMPKFLDPLPLTATGVVDLGAVLGPWFAYARVNGHGWRMLFRDAGGDEEIQAFRSEVRARARSVVARLLESAGAGIAEPELLPTAELIRSGLAGLVLWLGDNPDVATDAVVGSAVRLIEPLFEAAR